MDDHLAQTKGSYSVEYTVEFGFNELGYNEQFFKSQMIKLLRAPVITNKFGRSQTVRCNNGDNQVGYE